MTAYYLSRKNHGFGLSISESQVINPILIHAFRLQDLSRNVVDGLLSGRLTKYLEETLKTKISGVAVAEPQPDPASEEWKDVSSQKNTGKGMGERKRMKMCFFLIAC